MSVSARLRAAAERTNSVGVLVHGERGLVPVRVTEEIRALLLYLSDIAPRIDETAAERRVREAAENLADRLLGLEERASRGRV